MKNLKKEKFEKKSNTYSLSNVFISILIIIPLIFLIIFNFNKVGASKSSKDKNAINNIVDSAKIKLEAAVNIAKINPNEANYINLSLQYYINANYNECVNAAKKALEYNSHSYAAYNNLCSAYNQLGLWEEAIIAGKKALIEVPGDQLAQNNLNASYQGKENLDKTILSNEALVKASPNENNLLSLGLAYYQARKYQLSINTYKKVIKLNKNNITAHNNICSAYNQLGNYKEAIIYCENAIKIDSTFSLSKNNLNEARSKLEQKQLLNK